MTFTPGTTVAWRNVFGGRVWSAIPCRVLQDTGTVVTVAHWPGVSCLVPELWRSGERGALLRDLISGEWRVSPFVWQSTTVISWLGVDPDFSIHFYRGSNRSWWYVNFQLPCVRGAATVDTFDLLVDLVLSADLAEVTWKDEDEYADGRRLGLIDSATHARVSLARDRALNMARTGVGPFADTVWREWSPTSDCSLPTLTAGSRSIP
ncbi:DUF402 domain-containing protein [Asanoa sp. NPDC050611]|uniref:DUF402 domain-containing protein n=1 Tax=Asanoa sp. NPDC050611 TaxID=3157098 RepID=UPI0033E2FF59